LGYGHPSIPFSVDPPGMRGGRAPGPVVLRLDACSSGFSIP
jgi:hypothetical protein